MITDCVFRRFALLLLLSFKLVDSCLSIFPAGLLLPACGASIVNDGENLEWPKKKGWVKISENWFIKLVPKRNINSNFI